MAAAGRAAEPRLGTLRRAPAGAAHPALPPAARHQPRHRVCGAGAGTGSAPQLLPAAGGGADDGPAAAASAGEDEEGEDEEEEQDGTAEEKRP